MRVVGLAGLAGLVGPAVPRLRLGPIGLVGLAGLAGPVGPAVPRLRLGPIGLIGLVGLVLVNKFICSHCSKQGLEQMSDSGGDERNDLERFAHVLFSELDRFGRPMAD